MLLLDHHFTLYLTFYSVERTLLAANGLSSKPKILVKVLPAEAFHDPDEATAVLGAIGSSRMQAAYTKLSLDSIAVEL